MHIHDSLRSLAVKVSSLTPDPANARKHGTRNLAAIQASLTKFGQLKPIVVQRQGMLVRAGNGTLAAATALGWEEIAAVVKDMTNEEATAYAIADNRTAELAEWDDKVLGTLLAQLNSGVALDPTLTGFNTSEIAKLAKFAQQALPSVPVPEPPGVPVTKAGDLWTLGAHRLLCGDSTVKADVERLMGEDKAVLCATDPPYGVAYDNSKRPNPGVAKPRVAKPRVANDELTDGPEMQAFLERMLQCAIPHMKASAAYYFWHPMLTQGTFVAAAAAAGILIHRQIIWVKPVLLLGHGDYHWRHELCFYGWRQGDRCPFYGSRDQDTIWATPHDEDRQDFNHANVKPLELFRRPLMNHALRGEIAYEPFAGSGTQMMAAHVLERRCFSMEIEPAYCDVIVERWQKLSGGKAQLQRGGKAIDVTFPVRAAAAPAAVKPKSRKKKP